MLLNFITLNFNKIKNCQKIENIIFEYFKKNKKQ